MYNTSKGLHLGAIQSEMATVKAEYPLSGVPTWGSTARAAGVMSVFRNINALSGAPLRAAISILVTALGIEASLPRIAAGGRLIAR